MISVFKKLSRHYNNENFTPTFKKYCKYLWTICLLLAFCGIVAYGLTFLIFRYYGNQDFIIEHQEILYQLSTVKPDPINTKNRDYKKRIVGYYYRNGNDSIMMGQLAKLTHAVFAFLELHPDGTIHFESRKAKESFLYLRKLASILKFDAKIMFSIGGPANTQFFSPIIQNEEMKRKFIDSIIYFLKQYKLDGVDLFWKWSSSGDKFTYSSFLQELKHKLRSHRQNYIISIVLPPAGVDTWELGYDLEEIMEHVDFMNVYSMDYSGPWDNQWGTPTGPSAPLAFNIGPRKNFNVDWTMKYYSCKTQQPGKFNMVIPFYARYWNNVQEAVDPRTEVFRNAEIRNNRADGVPYMDRSSADYKMASWDNLTSTPYIWKPDERRFFTFENQKSIAIKTRYAIDMNLGGVWIWSVDMGDHGNVLLSAVASQEFLTSKNNGKNKYKC